MVHFEGDNDVWVKGLGFRICSLRFRVQGLRFEDLVHFEGDVKDLGHGAFRGQRPGAF